jgi:hypothetical protein
MAKKNKTGNETTESTNIAVEEMVNSLIVGAIADLKGRLEHLKSEAEKRLLELDHPSWNPLEFPSMAGFNVVVGRIEALKRIQKMLMKQEA